MSIVVGPINKRGVDSGYSMVDLDFGNYEADSIVGERLAQKIIELLPEIIDVRDLDYSYFEGFRSKNGYPGFAIIGKAYSDSEQYLLKVELRPYSMVGDSDILEPYMTGPETRLRKLNFCVEAPYISPLFKRVDNVEYGKFDELLDGLKAEGGMDFGMGEDFYRQFEGNFEPKETIPDDLSQKLDGYLLVVVSDRKGKPEFHSGHFMRNIGSSYISMTGWQGSDYDSPTSVPFSKVMAIYGKGMEPLYNAFE